MSGSSSFFVEEAGMGESSERPDLVDSDSEGDVKEETQEEFARVEREINLLKKEKAVALLRGYLKKRVTEIQKKLSEKETWLGVLNEVQGLLRDVGEKEESQGSEKGDVSLDGLDLSGRFQHQFSPVKPPAPDGPCRQQNPSSFYFWDSYLRITIQKSIRESHNFLNDPIIKS